MNVNFAALASTPSAPPAMMPSPLQLADRMLTLAQDAERSGHNQTASQLVTLVFAVLDRPN